MNALNFFSFLDQHGQLLLLATVFLEQMGLPIPAYPSLIAAGAIRSTLGGTGSCFHSLGIAVLACLAADMAWYLAGRRFGNALMRLICQLSMSPDTCVIRSAHFYRKYGPGTLLIAKFMPGAGAMATLLAGANGTYVRKFLVYDALGSAIWSGSALALGYAFQDTVTQVIVFLKPFSLYVLLALAASPAAFLVVLLLRRRSRLPVLKLAPLMHISTLSQRKEQAR